jgi:hypothetical protein
MLIVLFCMLHGIRRELDRRIERGDLRQTDGLARTRDELAAFKLEVARTLSSQLGSDPTAQEILDELKALSAAL